MNAKFPALYPRFWRSVVHFSKKRNSKLHESFHFDERILGISFHKIIRSCRVFHFPVFRNARATGEFRCSRQRERCSVFALRKNPMSRDGRHGDTYKSYDYASRDTAHADGWLLRKCDWIDPGDVSPSISARVPFYLANRASEFSARKFTCILSAVTSAFLRRTKRRVQITFDECHARSILCEILLKERAMCQKLARNARTRGLIFL